MQQLPEQSSTPTVIPSVSRSSKIFCIGANKTGTTSLAAFFRSLGLSVGDQRCGELLFREWTIRNFTPIIALAKSAQVHQDLPFSLPFTFQAMDQAFPGSKFILSTRRDPEEWYNSLTAYHTGIVGKGRLPTAQDLTEFPYVINGWILDVMIAAFGVQRADLYNKQVLCTAYEQHNSNAELYFKHKPEQLLVVDLSKPDAARRVVEFIHLKYDEHRLPHLNQS